MIATSPTLGTSRHRTVRRATDASRTVRVSLTVLPAWGSRRGIKGLPAGESRRETTSKSTRNRTLGTEL